MVEPKLIRINAPAGSGKTRFISNKINGLSMKKPEEILAITFTNRAAEELSNHILSKEVEISTIHSFMNRFMKPIFQLPRVKKFYLEFFSDEINKELENSKSKEIFCNRFKLSEDTDISVEDVKKSLKQVYYNETNYNNYLLGGLSHDSLIEFAYNVSKEFKMVQKKLSSRYKYIFIDESQDTFSEILNFFYNSIKDTNTELWLLGDRMQQIHDNYDGSFEENYSKFDVTQSNTFSTNYRSSQEIVDVLNNLYLSNAYINQVSNKGPVDNKPVIVISNTPNEYIREISEIDKYFQLKTANKQRFGNHNKKKDLTKIYEEFSKIYKYGSNTSAMEVILPTEDESKDILLKLIYMLYELKELFAAKEYGKIIQMISQKRFDNKNYYFNQSSLKIKKHEDKVEYAKKLNLLLNQYDKTNDRALKDYINNLIDEKILNGKFLEHINNHKDNEYYNELLLMPLNKFFYLSEYKNKPNISTQHGVKGEGHDNVIFLAEDNKQVSIDMYGFFKMFSKFRGFSLEEFQQFYYEFKDRIQTVEKEIGKKVSVMTASEKVNEMYKFKLIDKEFEENSYYIWFKEDMEITETITLKNFHNVFNYRRVNYVLMAYKLFYVGCSRAKNELKIIVHRNEISDYRDEFKQKMTEVGFVIKEV